MATYDNATTSATIPGSTAPGDNGRYLIATSACMIFLTTISVALRFASRWVSKKVTFWWDDWCALAAWFLLVPLFSILIDSTAHGVGRHQGWLTLDQVHRLNLDIYIGQIFYTTGLTATKFSALFFYMRIFPWTHYWFRWSVWIGFALCAAWAIAITFLGAFQCTPARKYWLTTVPGTCLNAYGVNLGTSVPNVVIDTYILAIPMPFIINLQVTLKQKLGVAVVFFAGYATMALSVTRVVVTAQLTGVKSQDYSWNAVTFLEVVVLEPGLGLMSVCLPAQVYLFRFVLTEWFGVQWNTLTSSLSISKQKMKNRHKRRSQRVKSMIDKSKWRQLSASTSNTSYSAEIFFQQNNDMNHEDIQGIQVQTDVTVRPSSWAPQFVTLILG